MTEKERAAFADQLAETLVGQALVGLSLPALGDAGLSAWADSVRKRKNEQQLDAALVAARRGHYGVTRHCLEQVAQIMKPLPLNETHAATADTE